MAEETDGVREAFDDALRIALTVATQLGEKVARLREQFARQREARAVQTNLEIEARFEAERAAMRASLLPLNQPGWWEHATVADIANARETAVSWSDLDDVARQTNEAIEREVFERYDVVVNRSSADPSEVAEALRAAEMLLREADRRDREAVQALNSEPSARPDYDSAARRDEFATSLAGVADPETIAARILADGENARHPSEATRRSNVQAPKVRRTGVSQEQQRQRSGISGR